MYYKIFKYVKIWKNMSYLLTLIFLSSAAVIDFVHGVVSIAGDEILVTDSQIRK